MSYFSLLVLIDNWCNLDLIDTNCVKVAQVCGGTILESLTTGKGTVLFVALMLKDRGHTILKETHTTSKAG